MPGPKKEVKGAELAFGPNRKKEDKRKEKECKKKKKRENFIFLSSISFIFKKMMMEEKLNKLITNFPIQPREVHV